MNIFKQVLENLETMTVYKKKKKLFIETQKKQL